MLTDYAIEKGFEIEEIYIDEDFSGMDSQRPEFNRMLKDAKEGRFNTVICKTQSRFSRDMEIIEKYIHKEFPILGIRFIGVVDNVDTQIKGNKKARQINSLVNEWYIEDLSENIRAVFKKKMEAGQFLGSFAPYGYKKSDNNKYKLVIDEEAAKIVRKIFNYYIQGYSFKQIAYLLEDEKILPPSLYKKKSGLLYKNSLSKYTDKYGLWCPSTINNILTNTVYIGTLSQAKSRKISYKSKKTAANPKSKWIIIEKAHEAVVDEDIFNKVQELIKKRSTNSKINIEKHKIYPLSGKIKCLDCGGNLVRSGSYRGKSYLRCRLSASSRKMKCSSHSIIYEDLQEVVINNIKTFINVVLSNKENRAEIKEHMLKNNLFLEKKQLEKKIKYAQIEYESCDEKFKALYMDKIRGIITEDEFLLMKKEIEKSKKTSEALLRQYKEKYDYFVNAENNNCIYDKFIEKYYLCSDLTVEMAEDFIDHIEVGEKDKNKNQKIIIYWNI